MEVTRNKHYWYMVDGSQSSLSETTESVTSTKLSTEHQQIIEENSNKNSEEQKLNKPQAGGLSPGVSDEDLEKLLMDKRYLTRQIKCALGQGACDPVGRRLKSLAPLVLRGACPKCTNTEKRQIQKTLAFIQKNYPKDWARLMSTYTG
ncbi:ejaculatory bulb-specific protein 3-like isoform X2 [Condylostylus longicornis]|uniref:ejaculatory bulb-specific protein 3-like isoform X2 n=1 Tax=Condylostylus longicornis TaxID=2530218 RepID=UPI00244E530D|nr:ejaculatory bulb-specific protein 3-like isoform X2 [Condylostylus longicornis]